MQQLQELSGSSAVPPGSAARDQGRHCGGVHTLSCGDQRQVLLSWQEPVADTYMTGARMGSKGQRQLQAHWQLLGTGYQHALSWLHNLPLGV